MNDCEETILINTLTIKNGLDFFIEDPDENEFKEIIKIEKVK